MKVDIDFSEVLELGEQLGNDAPQQAMAAVGKVTRTEAALVKSRAKGFAPRDRPWLATEGIRKKTWRNKDGYAASVYVTPDPEGRPVALFIEYGTSRMPPQPFLGPALAPAEGSYPAAVLAAIDPFTAPDSEPSGGDEG